MEIVTMPYKRQINSVTELYRQLNEQITSVEKVNANSQQLAEMKQKLESYRVELSRLNRLQWEHDHDTVNFDDDR
jgi:hypothetical protein